MSIKKENTLILGGGLAGLSACYHGDGVVYEKDITDGGHARSHSSDGFIFDLGPSFYWMPDVFEKYSGIIFMFFDLYFIFFFIAKIGVLIRPV